LIKFTTSLIRDMNACVIRRY